MRILDIDFARLIILLLLVGGLSSGLACRSEKRSNEKVFFVATIHPVASILRELTEGRAEVTCLLPAGASPHTYEPRPSDSKLIEGCTGLFSVSPELDSWASELSPENATRLMDLIPQDLVQMFPEGSEGEAGEEEEHEEAGHHHHEGVADPHFWTNPRIVAALVPILADRLIGLDPAGRTVYLENAERFTKRLEELDTELARELVPCEGQSVVLFHPSFLYFLKRYGLKYAGSIEPVPGKEASPQYIIEVTKRIHAEKVKAVFTEPQLARRPAEIVSESAGVPLFELDPNGGTQGKMTYEELLRYNAGVFAKALR